MENAVQIICPAPIVRSIMDNCNTNRKKRPQKFNWCGGGWYGKNSHIRLLYCRTCKKRFSERKGTPLFGLRLPEKKMVSLLEHISEGCGVRKTSRLVGVHQDTVTRYARAAGEHAQVLHDELVAFSPKDQRGSV